MQKENSDERPVLMLPFIGNIDQIACLETLCGRVKIPSHKSPESRQRLIQDLWRALGDYLIVSGQYKAILKLLFPRKEEIKVEEILGISVDKLVRQGDRAFPLLSRLFAADSPARWMQAGEGKDNHTGAALLSAWSTLMLELGEFHLGDRYPRLEEDVKRNLLRYLCFKEDKPEEYSALYALFDSPELVTEIWERIAGDDIFMLFVDDKETFDHRWGLVQSGGDGEPRPDGNDGLVQLVSENKNVLWYNPLSGDKKKPGYHHGEAKKKIHKIFKTSEFLNTKPKTDILHVLVVDLLFKDGNGINRIEGDQLIEEFRSELDINPLIIGFTGGRSPFVINSADKAGADIVIMKERGETVDIPGSHGKGNSGGLFDLLWALSKNVFRWRFMEEYRKIAFKKFEEGQHFFHSVLDTLFLSIENESPFWKKYLTKWQKDMENERLKAILKE